MKEEIRKDIFECRASVHNNRESEEEAQERKRRRRTLHCPFLEPTMPNEKKSTLY